MSLSNSSSSGFLELSHTIEDGMITYQGLPAPIVCDFLSREASKQHYGKNTSFQIGKVEMVACTGTYIDAPFHRFEDGIDISQLPLVQLANLPAVVVSAPDGERALGPELFENLKIRGCALLIHTGWSRHWGTDAYFNGHPYLTKEAAELIASKNPSLVGIDSLNIDDTADLDRPVHTCLLGSGIPIVEHLTRLGSLPSRGFHFSAVPAPVKGMGSFPVRAYARLTPLL